MTASTGQLNRIAYCECGARLAGGSESELFAVAECHIAREHPAWLADRRASSISLLLPDCGDSGAPGGRSDRGR